jgi:hypothetical protein
MSGASSVLPLHLNNFLFSFTVFLRMIMDDHAALPASSCRLSSCGGSDQLLPKISTHTISTVSKYRKSCMEMLPKKESDMEDLIESVRTVAKCGITAGGGPDQEGFKYSSANSSEVFHGKNIYFFKSVHV